MNKLLLIGAIITLSVICWTVNLLRLSSCDFQSPYRCEIMHGIGVVVVPMSVITVWFDDDGIL